MESHATGSAALPAPSRQPPSTAKRALFFNFSEKPMSIVRVMDDTQRQQMEFSRARRQRVRLLALLFPAGLLLILVDWALGYNHLTFSLLGLALWGAAIAGLVMLARNNLSGQAFGPKFDAARTVFETLKDDIAPRRTLIGWLDLTGAQQPGKVVRERINTSGVPLKVYRDEWLRIKMPLYDGNVMRVSGLERVKARLGHLKRGGSGKMKWKSGRSITTNELQVAITVNKQVYEVMPFQYPTQTGKFHVDVQQAGESRIALTASTVETNISGSDVLQVLRFVYDHLKPRGTPAA
jgi:hypothetical protein